MFSFKRKQKYDIGFSKIIKDFNEVCISRMERAAKSKQQRIS